MGEEVIPVMKPVHVEALERFRLRIRFADETEGVADLGRFAHRGVFRVWDEPGAFDRVSIGPSGEIRWSEDVALCSDALYLTIGGRATRKSSPPSERPPSAPEFCRLYGILIRMFFGDRAPPHFHAECARSDP